MNTNWIFENAISIHSKTSTKKPTNNRKHISWNMLNPWVSPQTCEVFEVIMPPGDGDWWIVHRNGHESLTGSICLYSMTSKVGLVGLTSARSPVRARPTKEPSIGPGRWLPVILIYETCVLNESLPRFFTMKEITELSTISGSFMREATPIHKKIE